MLKSCSICGCIHDELNMCKRKTSKTNTEATKLRNTSAWRKKRDIIKERDNNLCQICLLNKYNTQYIYNYKDLEVHHIIPLVEGYDKRLDSLNLITLCRYHHELAEAGVIKREELQEIINIKYR